MARTTIEIDQAEFPLSAGKPFAFDGVHSGGPLSGIDITTTVYSDADTKVLEAMLKKGSATIVDPFSDKTYDATLHRTSSMYQEGRQGTTYRFEVKELDKVPQFEQLSIGGHTLTVLRNSETIHKNGVIGLNILLHLSPEEFQQFHGLLRPGAVRIKRIGIDESPLLRRFGGGLYWSSHEEGLERFYKQIARFYPTDFLPDTFPLASGQDQLAHSEMILELSARYEALVTALIASDHISQDSGEALMSDAWRTLVDDDRAVMMRSKLTQVSDADPEFD